MKFPVLLRLAPCLFFVTGFFAAPLQGQSVRGQVRFSEGGVGIPSVLVSLVDEAGEVVAGALSNNGGRFLLSAPAGTYTVRAERIGLLTQTAGPIEIGPGAVADVVLQLGPQAITLVGFDIPAGESRCRASPENAAIVQQVWGEVQKTLRVVAWGNENADVRYVQKTRTTDRSVDLTVIEAEEVRSTTRTGTQPFRAVAHEVLTDSGFARGDWSNREFFGPDADYLLSPAFIRTHCLEWGGMDKEMDEIALAFRPRPSRSVPDISGRILLDATTFGLKEINFTFENVRFQARDAEADGMISFGQMGSGEWLVDEWWIRTPRLGRSPGGTFSVVGYREFGGRVTETWGGVEGLKRGRSFGVVAGRVTDGRTGRALDGATVFLSGTSHAAVTDSEGAYRLSGVPEGVYSVALRHGDLQDFRIWSKSLEVTVDQGQEAVADLTSPLWSELRDRFCQGVETTFGAGLVLGWVEGDPGQEGASIVARWADRFQQGGRYSRVPLQPGTPVALCGLPHLVEVEFAYETRTDTIVLSTMVVSSGQTIRWVLGTTASQDASSEAISSDETEAVWAVGLGVFGRILDRDSDQPISDVVVTLIESGRQTVTDLRGRFRFPDTEAGPETLRISHLAYGQHDEAIKIPSNRRLTIDYRVQAVPLVVEGVDVIGESRPDLDFRGARFDGLRGAELDKIRARVTDMQDLVRAARIPGLTLKEEWMANGQLGTCIQLNRMAGRAARQGGQCQMVEVYVDGIRMPFPQTQLLDFDPERVARFELLSALEAGAIYGTGSMNGVLLITTR